MDDFIRIARELGLPGVALLMGFYLCLKLGGAAYEGIAWSGPQFFIPIRDGIVSNMSVLTNLIIEIRQTLPLVRDGHEMVRAAIARSDILQAEAAKEQAKTRAVMRATVQAVSFRCPEDADKCPFKQLRDKDSDEPETKQ